MLRITNDYTIPICAKAGKNGHIVKILPSDSYTFNNEGNNTIFVYTHVNEREELIGSDRQKLKPNPGDVVLENGNIYRAEEVPRVKGNKAAEKKYELSYTINSTQAHDMNSPFILVGRVHKDFSDDMTDEEKDVNIGHDGIPPG